MSEASSIQRREARLQQRKRQHCAEETAEQREIRLSNAYETEVVASNKEQQSS